MAEYGTGSYQQLPTTESLKEFSNNKSQPAETSEHPFFTRKMKVMALTMFCLVLIVSMASSAVVHRKQVLSKSQSSTDAPAKGQKVATVPTYVDTDVSTPTEVDTDVSIPTGTVIDIQPRWFDNNDDTPVVEEKEEKQEKEEKVTRVDPVPVVDVPVPKVKVTAPPVQAPVRPPVAAPEPVEAPVREAPGSLNINVPLLYSDARLSPLYMSSAAMESGWLRTLFSKYGFVGNRGEHGAYNISFVSTNGFKEATKTWSYATMYTGSDCDGNVQSVAGIANHECIPIIGFGGDAAKAIMMDCVGKGDVIMVAFSTSDCSGVPLSTAVLGVTKTCYAFSYSLADEPADSFYSTSTEFSCSTESAPELLGYDVQKLFLSSDYSAEDACNSYDLNIADGQIFEAFPTSTCIIQQQSDGTSKFALKFSSDDEGSPLVTYSFDSVDCSATHLEEGAYVKTKTKTTALYTTCEDQAWQGGVSVYGKWVHNFLFHPPDPTALPTFAPTDMPSYEPTFTPAPTASPKPTHYPTFYKPPQAPNVKPTHTLPGR